MTYTVTPVGSEFLVNTETPGFQGRPTIASLTNGGFVVTWFDDSRTLGDSSESSIKAQVFDANGLQVGNEFLVNTQTAGGQFAPTVTGLASGGFTIVWEDNSGTLGDSSFSSIKAQVFDATGVKVGGEFRVNTQTTNLQLEPIVAGLSNGGFVVTWQDCSGTLGDNDRNSVKAQLFNPTGVKVGGEFLVNTQTAGAQGWQTITGLSNGGFVISWWDRSGTLGDSSDGSIKAQIFDASGVKVGGEFLVNTQTATEQGEPAVTGLSSGGFVVAWKDYSNTLGDDSYGSIKAQVFEASGVKIGGEFLVNTQTFHDQGTPTITGLSNGGFIVSWWDCSARNDNSDGSVKAQAFDALGAKVGGEFLVNTQTFKTSWYPTITGLSNGSFIVAWENQFPTAASSNVKAQIYSVNTNPTITSNGGGDAAGINVAENGIAVTTLQASDPEPNTTLVYSITGGADAALFQINVDTGALSFKAAPNFEAPGGQGRNNTYYVLVQVSDGALIDSQMIAVTVTDRAEGNHLVRVGEEFLVNTATYGDQGDPTITGLSNGGFVVSWSDSSLGVGGAGGDTSMAAIKAQLYDASGAPVGGEFLVNTRTDFSQYEPSITSLSNGGFVASWVDGATGIGGADGDGSSLAVKAQVFNATGARVGGEFLVNTATLRAQFEPAITGLANGGFVVSWSDYSLGAGGAGGDTSGTSIKAQIFDSTGTRIGDEFLVNSATVGGQCEPTIAGLTDGGFIVSWRDDSGTLGDSSITSVKAQVFDASGIRVGQEFLVNTITLGQQYQPTITGMSDGGFVVSWNDSSGASGDSSETAIKGQIFSATGTKVGGEFLVNSATVDGQSQPTITSLSNGGFVVSWTDLSRGVGGAGGDASDGSIKAQVFDATGGRVGGEFLVNTAAYGMQFRSTIAGLSTGEFVVSWIDNSHGVGGALGDSTGWAIKAQRFTFHANPVINSNGGGDTASITVAENTMSVTTALASDPDTAVVTYSIIGGADAALFQIDAETGVLSFQAAPNYEAPADVDGNNVYDVTVQVSDGSLTDTQEIAVTVNNANDAPTGAPQVLNQARFVISEPASEFKVKTYTGSWQQYSAIAGLVDGGWIATWSSNNKDGSGAGVYGQRYDISGALVSGEFQVNTFTNDNQTSGGIAALADGGWVVTWSSNDQDGSGSGVFGQRYDSTGAPVGGEFRINTYTADHQSAPNVASLADGGWIIAWSSNGQDGSGAGIFGQRYDSSGAPVGGEFQINTYATDGQNLPSTIGLANGGWIVTWTSYGQDGSGAGVYCQLYNNSGTPVGNEIKINTYTVNNQIGGSVAALADGGWIVTWSSNSQDGSDYGVYGQRYDSSGAPVAGEFQINTFATGDQIQLNITSATTALADGGWVVTWSSNDQDGSGSGVFGQRYDSTGARVGGEFQVNTYTTSNQFFEHVAALSDGGWVINWTSYGQDGAFGLYGQRYDNNGNLAYTHSSEAIIAASLDFTQGHTLYADASLIADPDGFNAVNWQWQRSNDGGTNWSDIEGASNDSYTLTQSDVDNLVRLQVSYTDGSGTTETVYSAASTPVINVNDAPVVANAIADQSTRDAQAWSFQVPADSLADPDGDPLTYSASLADGSALPAWLTFDAETLTLTGTPPRNYSGSLSVKVTASDGTLTGSDVFDLNVVDQTAPTVSAFSPSDASIGVAVGSNITLTFSEAVQRGAGTIAIRIGSASGNIVESFEAASSDRISISGSTLTLDPTANLAGGTTYFVTFASGTVKDLSGNAYEGTSTYDFFTLPSGTVITGTSAANTLTGTAAGEAIYGLGGNDTITGAGGIDYMDGGEGSDLYIVASAGEHSAAEFADSGTSDTDEVRFTSTTAGTLTLFAKDTGIEQAVIGTGAAAIAVTTGTTASNIDASQLSTAISLVGNAGVNTLKGGSGNDTLTGGAGTDVLNGGAGSDLYIVAAATDHAAAEFADSGTTGTDELRFTATTAATLTLYAGDTGLEQVVIGTGTAATAVTTATIANGIDASRLTYNIGLTGNAGANALTGGSGNDTLTGNGGADTFNITSGTDTITDLGFGGADVLNVSAGATVNARVTAAWTASAVTVNKGTANIDTNGFAVNLAAVTATTAGNIGYRVTNSGAAATLTGSSLGDWLTGGAGNDTLTGGAGTDVLNGGAGSDLYIVAAATDHAAAEFADSGTTGTDELRFTATTAATLTLYAGDTGLEQVVIGTGTAATAVTTATIANGIDASRLTYNIGLTGNAGANALTGGSGNDTLTGNGGADTFNITSGTDTITDLGFGGADVLNVSAGATVNARVTAAWTASAVTVNKGTANISTNGFSVNLAAVTATTAGNVGFNVSNTGAAAALTGSSLGDSLTGGSGNDTLTGGAGIDVLNGGDGSDLYIVAAASDHSAAEFADSGASGTDELRFTAMTAATLTLYAGDTGLEQVVIGTGTAATAITTATTASGIDASRLTYNIGLTGNAGANALTGGTGNDTLQGGAGNDTLTGGAGRDTMNGGDGSDLYIIAAVTDHSAAEIADSGSSGTDEVRFTSATANATLTLYAGDSGIEQAVIGTGTSAAAITTGTTAINIDASALGYGLTLIGNAGANTLTGGSGNDTLQGGAGNDPLIGGAGVDIADYSTATTAITVSLAVTIAQNTGGAGSDTLSGIEGLVGGTAADSLTGNDSDNLIWGKAGNDTLVGAGGADQLRGGDGLDTLSGGAGTDWFIFDTAPNATTNRDTITDFVSGTDKLQFSKAVFTGLSSAALGDLTTDAFWSGAGVSTAHDATDRFIYNTTTGALFYDADGNAAGSAAVQVALLGATTHPTLSFTDIQIIG